MSKAKPITIPKDLKQGDLLVDRNGDKWAFLHYNECGPPHSQVCMKCNGAYNSVGFDGQCFVDQPMQYDIIRIERIASTKPGKVKVDKDAAWLLRKWKAHTLYSITEADVRRFSAIARRLNQGNIP